MKKQLIMISTMVLNILMATGAIMTGVMMIRGFEVFSSFPDEWLTKIPIVSWSTFGILAIVVYGLGNLVAFVLSIRKSYLMTVTMGLLLVSAMILQVILLSEAYLVTIEFILIGVIQLILGILSLNEKRKVAL